MRNGTLQSIVYFPAAFPVAPNWCSITSSSFHFIPTRLPGLDFWAARSYLDQIQHSPTFVLNPSLVITAEWKWRGGLHQQYKETS